MNAFFSLRSLWQFVGPLPSEMTTGAQKRVLDYFSSPQAASLAMAESSQHPRQNCLIKCMPLSCANIPPLFTTVLRASCNRWRQDGGHSPGFCRKFETELKAPLPPALPERLNQGLGRVDSSAPGPKALIKSAAGNNKLSAIRQVTCNAERLGSASSTSIWDRCES